MLKSYALLSKKTFLNSKRTGGRPSFRFVLFFCAYALLLGSASMSLSFEIKRVGEHIILQSPTCRENLDFIQSLNSLSENLGQKSKCSSKFGIGFSFAENSCSSSIETCLPDKMAHLVSIYPEIQGPNCFNLSLVMSQVLQSIRYSPPEELAFYIKSPLCRMLENSEKREAGDLGVMYFSSKKPVEEYHAFVYLSETLGFSKNGDGTLKRSSFSLQSLDKIYDTYDIPTEPQCQQNKLKQPSSCGQAVSYVRCRSLASYLAQRPELSREIREIYEQTIDFEKQLEVHLLYNVALPEAALRSLLRASVRLKKLIVATKKLESKNSADRWFMIQIIQMHFFGISEQLSPPFVEESQFKKWMQKIAPKKPFP